MTRSFRIPLLLTSAAIALVPAAALGRTLPDAFAVGPGGSSASACTATRSWSVGTGTKRDGDQPFVINCVGELQFSGWIDVATAKPPLATEACAPTARQVTLPGVGPATVRRCRDSRFSAPALVIETATLRATVVDDALAPTLTAMQALLGGGTTPVTVDRSSLAGLPTPADLPAGPAAAATAVATSAGVDARTAAALGLQDIFAGRYVSASQQLNDALTKFAAAPPLQRAELRLDAGLADSNLGNFEAADQRFAEAKALLAPLPPSSTRALLQAQAVGYLALHYNNKGNWQAVLDTLESPAATGSSLTDAATLARLNSSNGGDLQVGLDVDQANTLLLIAQQQIVRSIAYLRLGRPDDAERALREAREKGLEPAEATLQSVQGRGGLNWLRAGIERQEGRIREARNDRAGALASFDCGLATMLAVPLPARGLCLLPDEPAARGTPLGGPAVANAQLERAAIMGRQPGVSRAAVLGEYERAVAMLDSSEGIVAAAGLAPYLILLAQDAANGDMAAAGRYFLALQSVREPGSARDVAAIDAELSSGPAGSLLGQRRELERRRVQLRYQIASLAPDSPDATTARNEGRGIEARLAEIATALATSGARISPDSGPVTLDQLRETLKPGEAYLKLVRIGDRIFSAVVTSGTTTVYAIDNLGKLRTDLDSVLASARPGVGGIIAFRPTLAYDLFNRIAGPAAGVLRNSRAIIADTGDTLRGLPIAVLVTDPVAANTRASGNYSAVQFLVRRAAISTALSPGSFRRVRTTLTPSHAPEMLLGLGNHKLPDAPSSDAVARTPIAVGAACSISYATWASYMQQNLPISISEITTGAAEIGDPNAPIVQGDQFTTAAVLRDSASGRLARFQVLHFATHGQPALSLPGFCETPLPPALLTTVEPPVPGAPSQSNGLLTYLDVVRLKLDANLVILSACDTGSSVATSQSRLLGSDETSPSLDGLVRAFITARARAVMATYWQVPQEQGTAELMKSFYAASRTQGMGQALRQAQLHVLDNAKTSHPFYWGAFFLVGDGARPMLTPTTTAAR